jgi:phosphatidylethanolamine-binding protein (PEBP) family uncharacterized protein
LRNWNFIVAIAAPLALVSIAIAGCGEGSGSTTSASPFAKILETAKAHEHTGDTDTNTTTAGASTTPAPTGTTTTTTPAPASTPAHTTSAPASTKPAQSAAAKAAAREKLAQRLHTSGFGSIAITSSAFNPGGSIPTRYTCDGQNISPPLRWHGVPTNAVELFLLVADIGGGAGAALQWAMAMPAATTEIPAGGLPPGAVVGLNSLGRAGWGGVCGEKGKLQHITFILYALNHKLSLQPGFNASAIRGALKGGLASGFTVATSQR